jgi:hypothetical protein
MGDSLTHHFEGKLIDGLNFCQLAYGLYEEIRLRPDGASQLRERKRPIKRLIEEILPICRYVQSFYGPGRYISIKWVEGLQYDAEVYSTGHLVEFGGWLSSGKLEVTQAVHENDYLMRERLTTEGYAFGLDGLSRASTEGGKKVVKSVPTVHHNQGYIEEFVEIMLSAISEKISKTYPAETTLIVDCTLNSVYHRLEWEDLINRVRTRLPPHNFFQIFACAADGNYSSVV